MKPLQPTGTGGSSKQGRPPWHTTPRQKSPLRQSFRCPDTPFHENFLAFRSEPSRASLLLIVALCRNNDPAEVVRTTRVRKSRKAVAAPETKVCVRASFLGRENSFRAISRNVCGGVWVASVLRCASADSARFRLTAVRTHLRNVRVRMRWFDHSSADQHHESKPARPKAARGLLASDSFYFVHAQPEQMSGHSAPQSGRLGTPGEPSSEWDISDGRPRHQGSRRTSASITGRLSASRSAPRRAPIVLTSIGSGYYGGNGARLAAVRPTLRFLKLSPRARPTRRPASSTAATGRIGVVGGPGPGGLGHLHRPSRS